jgi:hypothetical protein
MELSFQKPPKCSEIYVKKQKIEIFYFTVVTLKLQDKIKTVFKTIISFLLRFLEAMTKLVDLCPQCLTKLNYKISVISDHHMLQDEIKLSHGTV